MPIVRQWLTEFEPGATARFLLGPSSAEAAFLPEITPLTEEEAVFGQITVKPVFDGEVWNDVLEVALVSTESALPCEVVVHAYSANEMSVHSTQTVMVPPGIPVDVELGPSLYHLGFLPEITPLTLAPAEFVQIRILPVFDGVRWNDVLRLWTRAGDSALEVSVKVYRIGNLEETAVPEPGSRVFDGMCALGHNAPNPFNPITNIRFWLGEPRQIKLEIIGVDGRLVAVIADGYWPEGEHVVTWNGCDQSSRQMASGVYFYRLEAGFETVTRRMLLLR